MLKLKVGRGGGSTSEVLLRVIGVGRPCVAILGDLKLFFSARIARRNFPATSGSDAELKKESIALFFMILGVHSGFGLYFWGKFSHFIDFEKLARINQSVGS